MERPLASLAKQVRHDPVTYKFGPVEIGVQPYRDFGWAVVMFGRFWPIPALKSALSAPAIY
ncbi:hypothetical protein FFK22_040130 [Mycobacterium sp. KBS0706]|uniref:hypothetical protein n=1 Tax=Mycobacterium sp. KBS0706 TaxID=2578109 RepID=UPI00110FF633|nr:hypothetical protein [Mycobacterium sp. KBS0706]TSD82987.1 hypothetical protein FFK22_040130 [Mycobacterium sp. KBS0706]